MVNKNNNIFKGFKKHPFLFIFGVLLMLFLTSLFLILTPIGWIILGSVHYTFTEGSAFQKIIFLLLFLFYICGTLILINSVSDN